MRHARHATPVDRANARRSRRPRGRVLESYVFDMATGELRRIA